MFYYADERNLFNAADGENFRRCLGVAWASVPVVPTLAF